MIRIEGGAKLAATLQSLPARVSKSIVRQALLEAAEPMRANASAMAPRAPGAPDIADHIVAAPVDGRSARGTAAVAYGPERGFHYGFFLEYGTSRQSAQPFMRPSFDTGVRPAMDRLTRSIWAALVGRGFGSSRSAASGGGLR